MNTAQLLRRAAKGAGIALIAGTVGGAALLAAEAMAARSRRYAKPDLGLAVRATLGEDSRPPVRLVLLGDSLALGVGVDIVEETVGGQLAGDAGRRRRQGRPVHGGRLRRPLRRPGHPGRPGPARPARPTSR